MGFEVLSKFKSQKRISMIWAFGSDVIENWFGVSLQIWLEVCIYAAIIAFPISTRFPELQMLLSLREIYRSVLYTTASVNLGIAIFWIICHSFQCSKVFHHSSLITFIIFLYFIIFLPKASSSSTNLLGARSPFFIAHIPKTQLQTSVCILFLGLTITL